MLNYDRSWIAARIPHQGSMCLLDAVRSWDDTHAICSASSHRAANNPLRHNGRLGAASAIEYAAQTMAVHAALLFEDAAAAAPLFEDVGTAVPLVENENSTRVVQRPTAGYLTSARSVQLTVARLDDIGADLEIEVERLADAGSSVLYRFTVSADGQLLASGRAAVVLHVAQLTAPRATS